MNINQISLVQSGGGNYILSTDIDQMRLIINHTADSIHIKPSIFTQRLFVQSLRRERAATIDKQPLKHQDNNMRVALIPVLFVLSAACVPALCGKEEPPVLDLGALAETRSRFAALDDVRLLANGLLQLGQSLREFVQKTKGQINDIFQKLNIFDHSFYQLSVLASEIKEEEEELKKTTVVLQANNEEIKGLSVQINSKVDNILQEKIQLQSKVEGLERKLSSLSHGLVTSEQVAEINSLRVSHLLWKPALAFFLVVVIAEVEMAAKDHLALATL